MDCKLKLDNKFNMYFTFCYYTFYPLSEGVIYSIKKGSLHHLDLKLFSFDHSSFLFCYTFFLSIYT